MKGRNQRKLVENEAKVFVRKHVSRVYIQAKFRYITSYGVRIGILIFFTNMFLCMHRVNLKVAITCVQGAQDAQIDFGSTIEMLTSQNDDESGGLNVYNIVKTYVFNSPSKPHHSTHGPDRGNLDTGANSALVNKTNNQQDFDWGEDEISFLLSSFYYGSFVAQVPGGYLSHRFGGKHVISVSVVISSICSLLTPIAARSSIVYVFLVRITLGLAWGLCSPALYTTIVNWTLTRWRASVIAVVFAGRPLGMLVSYLTARQICQVGWYTIFYVYGSISLLFLFIWLYEGYTSPEHHPRIPKPELEYLTQTIQDPEDIEPPQPVVPTPWKRLLSSRVHWATTFAHFARKWCYYSLIYSVPQFMYDVLQYNIKKSGIISTLPYLFGMLSMLVSGKLSTIVLEKTRLRQQMTRKLFTATSFVMTAICLTSIGHVTLELRYISMVLMCLTSISIELAFGGYISSFADFAGIFSGTSFAIANAVADTSLTLTSVAAGFLTTNDQRHEWQYNFYLASGISVIAAGVYCCFGETTLQKWAIVDHPDIYTEQIPLEDHSDIYTEQIPLEDHPDIYTEQIPLEDHPDIYTEQIPLEDHSDTYTEQIPLTGQHKSSTEPTILTDQSESSTDPTILTDHNESSTDPIILADRNESSTDPTILTDHNESSTDPIILTDHNESSTDPNILTDHDESSTDPTLSTDQLEAELDPTILTSQPEVSTDSKI